jgi:NAD(P)-dependent dehydrogenase (short-subunit alcohol dehydrogenase family)
MREFEDRVAFVTGGGNGIGRAAALLFAERGARVAIADYDRKAGEDTAQQIIANGGEAIFVYGDITDHDAVRRMVDEAVEKLRGLDCAFNNAGITHPKDQDWDDDAFQQTLDINVTAVMQCMKHELRYMLPQRRGAIVNTSSIGGMVSSATPSMPAYTASKHAVIGLTKTVALTHARNGIRVNAIMPGVTLTNMVRGVLELGPEVRAQLENWSPIGRLAKAEEIAEAALWLCSDRASYVTGHALAVDGGILAQ